jgi:hypothetical protein
VVVAVVTHACICSHRTKDNSIHTSMAFICMHARMFICLNMHVVYSCVRSCVRMQAVHMSVLGFFARNSLSTHARIYHVHCIMLFFSKQVCCHAYILSFAHIA